MSTRTPSDDELHAYADGQLDPARHREIEVYLAAHPDAAREVAWIRDQTEGLQVRHADLSPYAPPAGQRAADVRRAVRRRTARRMALAATVVLAFGLGGLGGWQMRETSIRAVYLPMADATQAYRLFAAAAEPTPAVDFASPHPAELQAWLNRHFVQAEPIPDFNAYGFQAVGGRLVPSEFGVAAMVLYRNAHGQSIVYYVRPPGNLLHFQDGNRRDGDVLTQYWKQGRYFYAVVSPADLPAARDIQRAVAPDA